VPFQGKPPILIEKDLVAQETQWTFMDPDQKKPIFQKSKDFSNKGKVSYENSIRKEIKSSKQLLVT